MKELHILCFHNIWGIFDNESYHLLDISLSIKLWSDLKTDLGGELMELYQDFLKPNKYE